MIQSGRLFRTLCLAFYTKTSPKQLNNNDLCELEILWAQTESHAWSIVKKDDKNVMKCAEIADQEAESREQKEN